jgi:hypothetical protein
LIGESLERGRGVWREKRRESVQTAKENAKELSKMRNTMKTFQQVSKHPNALTGS